MSSTATESLPTSSRADTAARLEMVRARTLRLIESLSEDALNRVHDPLLSPIVWDLGHIATFEDLWLAQNAFGAAPLRQGLGRVYDPFTAPRSERGGLPYLRSSDCIDYMRAVRERVVELLASADLSADAGPLLADGFVYEMVLRHEQQHSETILQALQTIRDGEYRPPGAHAVATEGVTRPTEMLLVPEGPFEMGAEAALAGGRFAYDNERPRHEVEVGAFLIDPTPVTNGDFIAFVADGAYERPELWSEDGRPWLERGRRLPRYWEWDGDEFVVRSFDRVEPVDPDRPLCHVSWYEADAFARYAGKRLPTEAEWEKAASWDGRRKRAYPWGDARPTRVIDGLPHVGVGPPNGFGLTDLSGVCHEWCADWFADDWYATSPARNPRGPEHGTRRVSRGGAWRHADPWSPVAHRSSLPPHLAHSDYGVRLARDV